MLYKYGYLLGSLIIILIWILFFLRRKDSRKEMIIISLIFGFLGIIGDSIFSLDWWHPQTITNSIPGIESFLFGFSISGIASVVYIHFFQKEVKLRKEKKTIYPLMVILLIGIFILLFTIYFLKINTIISSIITGLIMNLVIWIKRKDLIKSSIISGLLLVLLSSLFYLIPELIIPNWIDNTWYWNNLSGISIFKIPLEDLIWIFLTGAFIGPLYEYWQEARLINKKRIVKKKRK
jgi:predicted neutral ceramidase superfamily lipid hydrolase